MFYECLYLLSLIRTAVTAFTPMYLGLCRSVLFLLVQVVPANYKHRYDNVRRRQVPYIVVMFLQVYHDVVLSVVIKQIATLNYRRSDQTT